MSRTPVLIVCMLLLPGLPSAQEYASRLISVAEGLPAREVSAIAQDGQGLLWIATWKGVCSYDGYEVTNFGMPSEIPVQALSFDLRDQLYARDARGVIYRRSGSDFDTLDLHAFGIDGDVLDLAFDQAGNAWLLHGPSSRLMLFDSGWRPLNEILLVDPSGPEGIPRWSRIALDRDTCAYVLTGRTHFAKFDGSGRRLGTFELDAAAATDDHLRLVAVDRQGPVAISNRSYVIRPDAQGVLRPDQTRRLQYGLDNALVHSSGMIYTALTAKHMRVHEGDGQNSYPVPLATQRYPAQGRTTHLREDRHGGVLIGSTLGAIMATPIFRLFEVYRFDDLDLPGNNGVRSIIDAGQHMYFNTNDTEFLRLDPQSGQVDVLAQIISKGNHLHRIALRDSVLYTAGHASYDLRTGRLANEQPIDLQKNARFDRRGRFITCGSGYFRIFDKPGGTLLLEIQTRRTRAMAEGPDGAIWLCGIHGLLRIHEEEATIDQYLAQGHETQEYAGFVSRVKTRLPAEVVFDMLFMDENTLWLVTSGGLVRLDVETGEHVAYTTEHGFPIDAIYSILPEGDSALWLGTGAGLCRFDVADASVLTYTTADGIAHDEFNSASAMISHDGYYYMGGFDGITRFKPEALRQRRMQTSGAPLMLRRLSVYDGKHTRILAPDSILQSSRLVIRPRDRIVTAHVALADYRNPDRNTYSYFLEGFDSGWTEPSVSRVVRYNNIPPGSYTMRVRGRHGLEAWSTDELRIPVVIRQAFVKTLWFPTLIVLVLSGLGYLLLALHYRQRLRLEQLRTRISSDLHDEVGGVLSGLAMQMDLLREEVPESTKHRLDHVAQGSRKAAAKMRDVIWAVDASRDFFEDLEERMKAFAIEMLSPLGINFYFDSKGMAPAMRVGSLVRQNVLFIFKEAITNIAKHSDASEVHITVHPTDRGFTLTVQDNGKGLPVQADRHQGNGMRYMQMRAERVGAGLQISSDDGVRIVVEVAV